MFVVHGLMFEMRLDIACHLVIPACDILEIFPSFSPLFFSATTLCHFKTWEFIFFRCVSLEKERELLH